MKTIYRPVLALLLAGSGVAVLFLGMGWHGIIVGFITIGAAIRYLLATPIQSR